MDAHRGCEEDNVYSNPFDAEDPEMDKGMWEKSVDEVQLYISSLNFWRDNGSKNVDGIGIFEKISNYDQVTKFDDKN